MSRPDRRTFLAASLEGRVLEGNARLLLRFLWDLVRLEPGRLDREGGPAPIVPVTKIELQDGLGFSPSTTDAHLKSLHDAWWMRRVGLRRDLHHLALLNPGRRDQVLQSIGSSTEKEDIRRLIFERWNTGKEGTDCPSSPENSGRSSRKLGQGSREFGEIFPNSRDPRELTSLTITTGLTCKTTAVTPDRAREAGGGVHDKYIAFASEILSEAIPPAGAMQLPATRHHALPLARLLAAGWPEVAARRLLARAPAIVARVGREPRFYTPHALFEGERHEHWLAAEAELERLEREDAARIAKLEAFEQQQREKVAQLNAEAAEVPELAAREGEDQFDAAGRMAREWLNRYAEEPS